MVADDGVSVADLPAVDIVMASGVMVDISDKTSVVMFLEEVTVPALSEFLTRQ